MLADDVVQVLRTGLGTRLIDCMVIGPEPPPISPLSEATCVQRCVGLLGLCRSIEHVLADDVVQVLRMGLGTRLIDCVANRT